MIHVQRLRKEYRVHRRPPGLAAALRSLVHRSYETVVAAADLSFRIEPGERVGFLGPNGAGKTTTLKVLSGLLHPTAGEVTVDGHVPWLREETFLKRIMLVLGNKQQLAWDLPPSETFELNRVLYDVPDGDYRRRLADLTDVLGIGALISKPTRQLSLGERMKCELAAALLHGPRVLFLDEPTLGLDVAMQATLRSFVKHYNESTGATLLLTSHYMEDVEALCPRVLVIDKGVLVYDGSLEGLVRTLRPEKRVVLRLTAAPTDEGVARMAGSLQANWRLTREGESLVLHVPAGAVRDAVAQGLALLDVRDLAVEDPPLEEVLGELFLRGGGPLSS